MTQFGCREHKVQLMSRKWIIQDDQGKVVDQVAGPGKHMKGASHPMCNGRFASMLISNISDSQQSSWYLVEIDLALMAYTHAHPVILEQL